MIRLTKNENERNVPLNKVASAALEPQKALAPHKPTDPNFPLPGQSADCRRWFLPALAAPGIAEYMWHNNCRTFCSWLAEAGVSIKEIQPLAGHKSMTMSARYMPILRPTSQHWHRSGWSQRSCITLHHSAT